MRCLCTIQLIGGTGGGFRLALKNLLPVQVSDALMQKRCQGGGNLVWLMRSAATNLGYCWFVAVAMVALLPLFLR